MAELVDALASGASARKGVGVQVPLRAHIKTPPGLRTGGCFASGWCPVGRLCRHRVVQLTGHGWHCAGSRPPRGRGYRTRGPISLCVVIWGGPAPWVRSHSSAPGGGPGNCLAPLPAMASALVASSVRVGSRLPSPDCRNESISGEAKGRRGRSFRQRLHLSAPRR